VGSEAIVKIPLQHLFFEYWHRQRFTQVMFQGNESPVIPQGRHVVPFGFTGQKEAEE
jgi:hypothetical protein